MGGPGGFQRPAIISVGHWKLLESTLATSNRAWPISRVRIEAKYQPSASDFRIAAGKLNDWQYKIYVTWLRLDN